MNPVSSYLLRCFEEHWMDSFSLPLKPIFSTLSNTYLASLFIKIHQANIEWEQLGDLSNIATDWHFSKNIENYHWIPLEIRTNWIEKIPFKDTFQQKFIFTLENRTFHIHLWFPIFSMSEKKIQEKVYSTIMKIYMWLHVSKNYLESNIITCSKTVHIYLFLTEHVKFLPSYLLSSSNKSKEKEKEMINEIHANTAFTTGCTQEKTNIFVYREEEWFKVLIHETFHNLGLDFIDMDKPEINTKIRNLFPISVTDIRSYETYTEMWAEILNMIFTVYFLDIPRKKGRLPINRWIHTLASFYKIQLSFSLFQLNKILLYQGFTYPDLFLVEKASKYTENTQIFAYYVMKSIWMFHINDFLYFCTKGPTGFSLKFPSSSKYLDIFIDKLLKISRSPAFLRSVQEMYLSCKDFLVSVPKHKRKQDFLTNTLRMTIHELI